MLPSEGSGKVPSLVLLFWDGNIIPLTPANFFLSYIPWCLAFVPFLPSYEDSDAFWTPQNNSEKIP